MLPCSVSKWLFQMFSSGIFYCLRHLRTLRASPVNQGRDSLISPPRATASDLFLRVQGTRCPCPCERSSLSHWTHHLVSRGLCFSGYRLLPAPSVSPAAGSLLQQTDLPCTALPAPWPLPLLPSCLSFPASHAFPDSCLSSPSPAAHRPLAL